MEYDDYEVPEREFDLDVTITMTKRVSVTTDDYVTTMWHDSERDEDGNIVHTGGIDIDTNDTDWEKAYKECRYTIAELFAELKKYINAELSESIINPSRKRELNLMLDDLDGWEIDTDYYNDK